MHTVFLVMAMLVYYYRLNDCMESLNKISRQVSFSPLLTSQAGVCLTMDNWHEIGVQAGIFSLEALMTKPGIEVLKSFRDLRHYTGWEGKIILYVGLKPKSSTGDYVIRSPYDGGRITLTQAGLLDLIQHLQADKIIGLHDDHQSATDFVSEHDKPAVDAFQGVIYESPSLLRQASLKQIASYSLLEPRNAIDFSSLAQDCACPTCQGGATRAYLHHLLQHTPLLAQRLLIMHNVFFVMNHTNAN